jgi:hypothetical protein
MGVERAHEVADVLEPGFDGVLHFATKSLVAESVERPELLPGQPLAVNLGRRTRTDLNQCLAGGEGVSLMRATMTRYGDPGVGDLGPRRRVRPVI